MSPRFLWSATFLKVPRSELQARMARNDYLVTLNEFSVENHFGNQVCPEYGHALLGFRIRESISDGTSGARGGTKCFTQHSASLHAELSSIVASRLMLPKDSVRTKGEATVCTGWKACATCHKVRLESLSHKEALLQSTDEADFKNLTK